MYFLQILPQVRFQPKQTFFSEYRLGLQMSRDDSVNKMLEVYEQPLVNSITDTSEYSIQPVDIKVALRPHQLAMIHAMQEKERSCIEGFNVKGEIHHSQISILGDKVGSGKTLMLLGYISNLKRNPQSNIFSRIHHMSQESFWSQKPVHTQECSGNTLIIVPHTLFHQWKFAIQQQTTLSFFEVKTTKALEKADFHTLIKERDITLMSNTIIKQFMADGIRDKIQWSRVVFDEIDIILWVSLRVLHPHIYICIE